MVKVLIVDDELDFCNYLEETLSREGYQVIIATSGREAIEKVKKDKPHLILLDIRMPEMDGIDTLERIRQIDKEAVIMMVTVEKDAKVAQRAIKLGAVDYMTKPLDLDSLKRSIQTWAAQIEVKQLNEIDIVAFDYDEEKFKTILDLFTKMGYKIKCVENKSAEPDVAEGPFDLLILRADIMADEAIGVLSKYKEAYPDLPVMIIVGPESATQLMNRIKRYGRWQYLSGYFDTQGLVLITYRMVSRFQEKRKTREEKKHSEHPYR